MKRWLQWLVSAGLIISLPSVSLAEATYVVVDQAIAESARKAKSAGIALASQLGEPGAQDVQVVVLPAKAVRIVGMTQTGDRLPDFGVVSDVVASPSFMCRQLVELLQTLPLEASVFKLGREDAAWNEAAVLSENREFLNEIPMNPETGAVWSVLDYYIGEDTTLDYKQRIDDIIRSRSLKMNWVWNKPSVPLAGYRPALHLEEAVDMLPLPTPAELPTEEELAEIVADYKGHIERSLRDDPAVGDNLALVFRMAGLAGSLAAFVTGQGWLIPFILAGTAALDMTSADSGSGLYFRMP